MLNNKARRYIIGHIRRAWRYYCDERKKALEWAKLKNSNTWQCAICMGRITKQQGPQVDHIEPIVPVTGWQGFDSFINRLFCPVSKLQVAHKNCHKEKSKNEAKQRALARRRK